MEYVEKESNFTKDDMKSAKISYCQQELDINTASD